MLLTRLALDEPAPSGWPFDMPAVAALAAGLDLVAPVTFLVGENGSGKSTIVEAIADVCGMSSEGGKAGTKYASRSARTPLGESLRAELTSAGGRLIHGPRLKRRAFFFRAETLFDLGQNVSGLPGFWVESLDDRSHGEGFFTVLDHVLAGPGLYLMDEPEAALSFSSCLRLIALLAQTAASGGQVICATHSPLLAGMPGARLLEIGAHGIREVDWSDLELVEHWRRFLNRPEAYLRHLVAE